MSETSIRCQVSSDPILQLLIRLGKSSHETSGTAERWEFCIHLRDVWDMIAWWLLALTSFKTSVMVGNGIYGGKAAQRQLSMDSDT